MSGGRSGRRSTLGGAVVLVAVWAAGVAVTWGGAPPDRSAMGPLVVVAAGCLAGALAAWLLARLGDRLAAVPGRAGLAVAAGLAAIAVRLAFPLPMLAWLGQGGAAGAARMLLGLYLSLLATDIVLTIIRESGTVGGGGGSSAN